MATEETRVPAELAPPEQALAWERAQRVRAGVAGIVAGVFALGGAILLQATFRDAPRVLLIDGLRDAAGQPIGRAGLATQQILFYDDHAFGLIVSAVLVAIGAAGTAMLLGFLFAATKARNPAFGRVALIAALLGAGLLGVSELVLRIGIAVSAHDFAAGADMSSQAARDALKGSFLVGASAVRQLAVLPLALGFVLIGLNAMRVGLLTRFMGILAIIVGVLSVFPFGSPLPIVPGFWLIAAGVLAMGRWPTGMPPAWETGTAMPWPTQQELREQREAAQGAEPEPEPVPTPAAEPHDDAAPAAPRPGSKKRKRKRR